MNNIDNLVKSRHSVRQYLKKEIESDKIQKLNELINQINNDNNLHIQLILNDSKAFDKFIMHYGRLDANNYLAMIGEKKDVNLAEKIGYYGEKIVLAAQDMGLNTCWVSGTFSKNNTSAKILDDEEMLCVIAIGYGKTQGISRKSKTFSDVSISKDVPAWYKKGIEYALLAPTALNEQKFKFELLDNNIVSVKSLPGLGPTKIDLGIVKYHFELGAGTNNFDWME